VDPPINRETRGGVDPIPLRLPPSRLLSLPSLSHSLSRRSDLAIVVSSRPLAQLPTSASPELASLLRVVLLQRMRIKTLCHIRSSSNPSGEMAAEAAYIPDPQRRGSGRR
jgi:hypothetical protein